MKIIRFPPAVPPPKESGRIRKIKTQLANCSQLELVSRTQHEYVCDGGARRFGGGFRPGNPFDSETPPNARCCVVSLHFVWFLWLCRGSVAIVGAAAISHFMFMFRVNVAFHFPPRTHFSLAQLIFLTAESSAGESNNPFASSKCLECPPTSLQPGLSRRLALVWLRFPSFFAFLFFLFLALTWFWVLPALLPALSPSV